MLGALRASLETCTALPAWLRQQLQAAVEHTATPIWSRPAAPTAEISSVLRRWARSSAAGCPRPQTCTARSGAAPRRPPRRAAQGSARSCTLRRSRPRSISPFLLATPFRPSTEPWAFAPRRRRCRLSSHARRAGPVSVWLTFGRQGLPRCLQHIEGALRYWLGRRHVVQASTQDTSLRSPPFY